MKLKLVRFLSADGVSAQARQIPGLGRVLSVAPGDDVKDVAAGLATIASLEYEPRSGAIIIRKRPHKDNPTENAHRSWNRDQGGRDPLADWCAISIGTAQILGDDEPAQAQQRK